MAVSPWVTAFTPVAGLNDVAREVKVSIAYLPYPGTVLVTFGGEQVNPQTLNPKPSTLSPKP